MMSYKLKANLCLKVLNIAKEACNSDVTLAGLLPKISLGRMKNGHIAYVLPLSSLESFSVDKTRDFLRGDEIISNILLEGPRKHEKIILEVNTQKFVKMILEDELEKISCGKKFFQPSPRKEKVVVEYSSLNIAKPFHVGHLRSTIIGNFISNIQEFLGNDVVRMNYLGDWGTQFGLLQVGIDKLGYTDDMIQQNPTRKLYEAYVAANRAAETDADISEKARKVFQSLEEGSFSNIDKWEMFRNCTIKELEQMYGRLNVRFDAYEWESSYSASRIQNILKILEDKRVMKPEADGRKMVGVGSRQVPLVKSDGTTLYLTRDVAAAMHRHSEYDFDRMLYVVDNSQSDHFVALFNVLSQLGLPWSDKLQHVKFGRIRGMSTRKGSVVFLTDILDEARDLMRKKQQESASIY